MKREDKPKNREPTRVPGEGGIELESTAGNIQLTPANVASLWKSQSPEEGPPSPRKKKPHRAPTYGPGTPAPASGVYNVVDEAGKYLEVQITSHAGKPLPPPPEGKEPCKYELAYKAIHLTPTDEPIPYPPEIHRSGETVPVSGLYNVVDAQGRYLFHQRALVEETDKFPPLEDPLAEGYALAFPAKHLAHGPERH